MDPRKTGGSASHLEMTVIRGQGVFKELLGRAAFFRPFFHYVCRPIEGRNIRVAAIDEALIPEAQPPDDLPLMGSSAMKSY